jgi:hypothetical protein
MGFSGKCSVSDADYLLERAVAEARLAAIVAQPECAARHRFMAEAYLDRVFALAITGPASTGSTTVQRAHEIRAILQKAFDPPSPQNVADAGERSLKRILTRLDCTS